MPTNRKIGNDFEQELCELLFENGFWAKNLKQDNSGQPADVIAVKNGRAYLIDCKVCSNKAFKLDRVEENQQLAMELWKQCGNGNGLFAVKIDYDIYMINYSTITFFLEKFSSLNAETIAVLGVHIGEWVTMC